MLSGVLGVSMKIIIKKLNQAADDRKAAREEQKAHNDLSKRADLAQIAHTLNFLTKKFIEQGFCPLYEQRNLTSLFIPYEELGGNGDIARDYHTCLSLPPKPDNMVPAENIQLLRKEG